MKDVLLTVLFLACGFNLNAQPIENQVAVKTHILKTWYQSRVDSNTWRMKGSIALPKPFLSIREHRNVLFGWDPYFTNAGLLLVDSLSLYAIHATDNQLYEVDRLGYVPNASEPWGLNRSQIPFLSMMVREVYEKTRDRRWLKQSYPTLLREYKFWTDEEPKSLEHHSTPIAGLQRFSHHATETELLRFYDEIAPRFNFPDSFTRSKKLTLASHWMAEAESGMDFCPRFENRCQDFIPVDLNSNLYTYERNFAWMEQELGISNGETWNVRAQRRRALLLQYCWNGERGLFMDYDFVHKRFSKTASVAAFYTLLAGLATKEQAQQLVDHLSLFDYPFGPAVCEQGEHDFAYQWDYPAGWPPLYYIVAKGLSNYQYPSQASAVALKYLRVVSRNFFLPQPATYTTTKNGKKETTTRQPGFVYEKYDVTNGGIYDAEYPSRTFQGWSYGVYVWCLTFCENR